MTYKGVKFKTFFADNVIDPAPQLEELKKWCQIFHEKDLAPAYQGGSYGNLSFRRRFGESAIIITGSRIGLKDRLNDDSFVEVKECDFEKRILKVCGRREPSSESMLHFAIYKARPEINAIFHGHSEVILSQAVALGFTSTKKYEPYGTIELVNRVLDIASQDNFLIMQKHGFLALGNSLQDAGSLTLNMLEKCLLWSNSSNFNTLKRRH